MSGVLGGSFLSWLFFRKKNPREIFEKIHKHNIWRSKESVSGPGSTIRETKILVKKLPDIFEKYKIKAVLDIPCGDFNWMKTVDITSLDSYIGADIVKKIIDENNRKYKNRKIDFVCLDLIEDKLPKVDMVFVRDCLVHLSYKQIFEAIKNLKKSGSKYLMTTNYPVSGKNVDIVTGGWRPLKLTEAPFNFPKPIDSIIEGCEEINGVNSDKSMTLWKIADLP